MLIERLGLESAQPMRLQSPSGRLKLGVVALVGVAASTVAEGLQVPSVGVGNSGTSGRSWPACAEPRTLRIAWEPLRN